MSIQSLNPPLMLVSIQTQNLLIAPVTLPSGVSISDFQSFTVTIRADPAWPRQTAATLQNVNYADPVGDGWQTTYTGSGTGSVVNSVNQVVFAIPSNAGLLAGINRYACVVWGVSNLWGNVQLLGETFLTVGSA